MGKRKQSDDSTSDSTTSDDERYTELRERSTRQMHRPSRYGNINTENRGNTSNETEPDPFGCGTSDESLYFPPKKSRKNHNGRAQYKYQNEKELNQIQTDFNSQFDMMSKKRKHHDPQTKIAPHEDQNQNIDLRRMNIVSDRNNDRSKAKAVVQTVNTVDSGFTLDILNGKVDRLLAEFAVMKEHLIQEKIRGIKLDEGLLHQKIKTEHDYVQKEAFFKSNQMPIKNIDDLNRFEANLKSSDFYLTAVRIRL